MRGDTSSILLVFLCFVLCLSTLVDVWNFRMFRSGILPYTRSEVKDLMSEGGRVLYLHDPYRPLSSAFSWLPGTEQIFEDGFEVPFDDLERAYSLDIDTFTVHPDVDRSKPLLLYSNNDEWLQRMAWEIPNYGFERVYALGSFKQAYEVLEMKCTTRHEQTS